MKKLAIVLIGLTVGLATQAAAQGPVERFAYVDCQTDYWDTGELYWCTLNTSSGLGIPDGTEPAWSPDGSRLAFVVQGLMFVLNLEDGSVADLGGGSSPAWSPDGLKIAFSGGGLYVMDADGSSSTPITTNVGFAGLPAWSRDGRIVFDCVVESGNGDICAINADGTGLVRLTTDPAWDTAAAPSPVDSRIAFLTTRYGSYREIAVMNADGSGVSRVGTGIAASDLAWLPDGVRIGFVYEGGIACPADGRICPPSIGFVNADGTGMGHYGYGWYPAWTSSRAPFASLQWHGCNGLTCTFDGSTSWGAEGITSYAWAFGDGTSDSGATVNHTYVAAGEFTVALTVTDSVGATSTRSQVVNVVNNAFPIASFTYDCNGPRCTFDGSGSSDFEGPIASYYWIFGDGHPSGSPTASPTITHTFPAGTFSVTLIVSDNATTGTLTRSLTVVNALPVASFTSTCTGLMCALNASASSDADGEIRDFVWQFGTAYYGSGPAVMNYAFAAPGTYTVTLTIWDDANQVATRSETVTVGNAPPVASFTSACSGRTCTVNGSGSDADGTIASYMWSFGDGTAASGQTATHSYSNWGNYTVTLTITDNGGATGTQSKTVSLVNAPPVASFMSSCSGRTCTVNGSGSDADGTIASFTWSFGDGTAASGQTAARSYTAWGTYTITLTVTDDGGAAGTQSKTVSLVNPPPVASFTLGCSNRMCNFNGSASSDADGPILSYVWNFGDGTAASGQTATHTYSAAAIYIATLTVTDDGGATGIQSKTVTVVNTPPVASITLSCGSLTCTANGSGSSDAEGPLTNYAWSFGDGTAASGQTVSHTYSASGSYTVSLTVTDNDGAASTTTRGVTVAQPEMHLGDLDGATQRVSHAWNAFVTVTAHDSNHNPIANAIVSGSWSSGQTAGCTTSAFGQCSISRSAISNNTASVTFTVSAVTYPTSIYRPAANHDLDGDSNGTRITLRKP